MREFLKVKDHVHLPRQWGNGSPVLGASLRKATVGIQFLQRRALASTYLGNIFYFLRGKSRQFKWHSPSSGGKSKSKDFLACNGHSFLIVSRSSSSAWSSSSAERQTQIMKTQRWITSAKGCHLPGRNLILRFSRTRANKVVVKCTLPSSVNGIFIRINFYETKPTKCALF